MEHLIVRLGLCIGLTILFYWEIDREVFARQTGAWWAEHANLIWLMLLPHPFFWLLGLFIYWDDANNHYQMKNGYSLLHDMGEYLRLYELKWWLGRKTGWKLLEDA